MATDHPDRPLQKATIALKCKAPVGATLLIRECSRPGYDRSYRVYTVQTGEERNIQSLDCINLEILELGFFEPDELNTQHIRVPGTKPFHAQYIAQHLGLCLHASYQAFTYEEI